MRIWIDIANSPHATFFAPIGERLAHSGHELFVTAWDRAQTMELAREAWPDVTVVGAGSDRNLFHKATKIWRRAASLREVAGAWAPDVALSHNSYSQILAAKLMKLPIVTMMDYEFQPANHAAFRMAGKVVVPEAFPVRAAERMGARGKLFRYSGYKEEVTASSFSPNPRFRELMEVGEDQILVAVRPPPDEALYHRHKNDLFETALTMLAASGATILLSPRSSPQAERYSGIPEVRVIDGSVSGLDLLWHADLVVGAGGTMTREAAILGTPSYTLFSGKRAAVDESLIREGRLTRIETPADLALIAVEKKPPAVWEPQGQRLDDVVSVIARAIDSATGSVRNSRTGLVGASAEDLVADPPPRLPEAD